MGRITLHGLQFKAYHGYYQEERELGNHFEVSVTVETDFEVAAEQDDLNGTVDYERIYDIVKDEMKTPSHLLEHVVNRILSNLINQFPEILEAEVTLSKLNPPIGGPCKAAIISAKKRRD